MKKNKNLTTVLYAFVILSLLYTCFTMFQSYGTVISYYGSEIGAGQILMYVISNVFVPLMMTVVLYALTQINEMIGQLLPKEEQQVEEVKVEEKVEEVKVEEKDEE